MQSNREVRRFQQLAGLTLETETPEQAAQSGLEDFLGDLKSASKGVKPSAKDGEVNEAIVTLLALTAGAPGLLNLLGKGADLIGKHFSQGTVNSTKVGAALQRAGHKLEHKYIESIAGWLQVAYPSRFKGQDPFNKESELHDQAHGIYAALLGAAAVGSGLEAANAVSLITKGLEGGAAAFKTSEVIELVKKIASI